MELNEYQRIKKGINYLIFLGIGENQKEIGMTLGYADDSSFSKAISDKRSILKNKICSYDIGINRDYFDMKSDSFFREGAKSEMNINGDTNGDRNIFISGGVEYGKPSTDINNLLNNYNKNKGSEIDRLENVYSKLIEDKNNIIEAYKQLVEEMRRDKELLQESLRLAHKQIDKN